MKVLQSLAVMILCGFSLVAATTEVIANDETVLQAALSADKRSARMGELIRIRLLISAPAAAFSITHDPVTVTAGKLIPLSKQKYQKTVNSMERQYLDTRWVLAGNGVGKIDINAITVRATLPVSSAGTNATKNPKVDVSTKAMTLAIEPVDKQHQPWFTATDVNIESHWPTGKQTLSAGVPVTRQIRIIAKGQLPAAIPPVHQISFDGARVYPGVPELELSKQSDGITGIRVEPMTIMLTQSGEVTLPPVAVNWWNSDSRTWQEALLPAETLQVAPGMQPVTASALVFFKWLTFGLALLCCILSALLVYFWWKYQKSADRSPSRTTLPQSEKHAWRALHSALRASNYAQFRPALRHWLRIHALSTEQLEVISPTLAGHLRAVDRSRYASSESQVGENPQLATVLPLFKKLRRQLKARNHLLSRSQDSQSTALYPLKNTYPDR